MEKYSLHCPFKQLTGVDCPGCGFQRSFIALLKGHFAASFYLYPATVPILLLALFLLLKMKFPFDRQEKTSSILLAFAVAAVTVSYTFKMMQGRL